MSPSQRIKGLSILLLTLFSMITAVLIKMEASKRRDREPSMKGDEEVTELLTPRRVGVENADDQVVFSAAGDRYFVVFESERAVEKELLQFIEKDLNQIFFGTTNKRVRELSTPKIFNIEGEQTRSNQEADFLFDKMRKLVPRQFLDTFGYIAAEKNNVVMTSQLLADYREAYERYMERRSVYEALIRDLGVINRNEVRSPFQWFYPEERIPDPESITKEWFDAEYGGYNLRVPSVLQVETLEEKFGANVWDLEPEWEASLKGKLIAEIFIEGKDGADHGPRLVYDEDDKQWKLLADSF